MINRKKQKQKRKKKKKRKNRSIKFTKRDSLKSRSSRALEENSGIRWKGRNVFLSPLLEGGVAGMAGEVRGVPRWRWRRPMKVTVPSPPSARGSVSLSLLSRTGACDFSQCPSVSSSRARCTRPDRAPPRTNDKGLTERLIRRINQDGLGGYVGVDAGNDQHRRVTVFLKRRVKSSESFERRRAVQMSEELQENRTVSLLLCLIILLATIHNGNAERKIVCYYTNWSIYRPGTAKFSPQNINPYLCTHLIYAFGGFTKDNALKPFDKYQDIEKGGYAKFTGLKTYNKNLKTLLAIGGWNEGSSRLSPMVADSERRREFVKNAIKFLRKNHFDGLDLDWEYPAFRDGGKPRDKDNYASLVQELREEFEREASKTGRPRLLLSLAMPAGIEYIDKGYDVPRLNEYLDFINLLSYDYHSSYEPAVNHHSPLYPLEEDNEYNYDSELTIDYTVNYLLKKGASPKKIILGIPTYGRSYTLFNQDATELGSPADGPGVEGEATREKGYLAYYEICENLSQSDDWEVIQPNEKAMGPYAFKGDQWVGYDDIDIVKLKAKYANEKNLGGIMFWTIDNDDFRGKCHDRPYPLIEAAKEALLTENSNSIQKSKTPDSRKKPRAQGVHQGNTIGRKPGSNARRSTTTAAPVSKKRVSTSRPRYRTFSRPKPNDNEEEKEEEEEDEEEEEQQVDRRSYEPSSDEEENSDGGNAVRTAEKNDRPSNKDKSRSKNRLNSNRNRRKQVRRKEENKSGEGSLSNKLTTPEPPTTPDPGTDFKCEDEGFFSHPRDCKKYFWCLDSGPGGLGVVAHQFTCPSGLVFNKAADSCDYPRNVVCPKPKTQSATSTTRAPITAATSRTTYLYSTTRKPSTEKPDSDEDYEYYDDDDDDDEVSEEEEEEKKEEPRVTTTPKALLYKTISRKRPSTTTTTTTTTTESPSSTTSKAGRSESEKVLDLEDEEDPKVIKELIKLIKKAGGIEQLEKQLLVQGKASEDTTNSGNENATPATISRTLYERVLNRQASKTASRRRTSTNTNYANGPGKAQFEGLDEVPEVKSLRRSQKPQYVTIERPKPSTEDPPARDEEDEDVEDSDEDNADVASSEEQTVSNPFLASSTQRATPNYINIRRNRPTTPRNENDVEEKNKDTEKEVPVRSRRPSFKSGESSSIENTRDQESRSPANEESSQTTKSRYVSIQRFRSTTPQPEAASTVVEIVSEVASPSLEPVTEPIISSETPNTISQKAELTTTSATSSTNGLSSIGVSSTPNDIILVETETVKPISNVTPESSSSTTEPVKLVEDSATEILLTTAPATSSSTLSVSNVRISTASVSQPRPFSFNRRNKPSTEPTTTPLSASNDQTRSKVSISSRNHTRSSFLPGRGRLRPRQENAGRNHEPTVEKQTEQIEETPIRGTRGRSRGRGASRYTPPSFKARTEEPDSVNRERVRTIDAPSSTVVASTEASRRRFRRPTSRTTTESTKSNELEDSPIVRITQGYPRRSLSSRSRSTVKEEVDSDKITNIKVFKKPATVNKDVYARTRYTRKRNNVDSGEPNTEAEAAGKRTDEVTLSTLSYSPAATSTVSFLQLDNGEKIVDNPLKDIVTEEPRVNSIDEIDRSSIPATIAAAEAQETTTFASSSNIDATNTAEPPVRITTDSTLENEVVTVTLSQLNISERMDQVLATTGNTVKVEDFDPNTIKIVFPTNSTDLSTSLEDRNGTVPKRRKVLLRRRPVPSSRTAVSREEEEENKSITRRRKVIKRLRPVQSTETTIELAHPEEDEIVLRFRSTTPIEEEQTNTVTGETVEASTESFGLSTAETEKTFYDFNDDSTRVTLETPTAETIIAGVDFTDSDAVTIASTITDNVTGATESPIEREETTEASTPESTTSSNFFINFTETENILDETLPSNNQLETLPTTVSQATTTSAVTLQPNRRLEVYNKTYYLDSRYVRKKFVRKRPVASSENATTRRFYSTTESPIHVSLTTERNDLEGLSKRRKSLFVRRRPVSSTTRSRTTQFVEEDSIGELQFDVDEKHLRFEDHQDSEDATLRINRANDENRYNIDTSGKGESAEFWNHYTTSSTSQGQLSSEEAPWKDATIENSSRFEGSVSLENEGKTHESSTPSGSRTPGFRPRYRVPESLKKTANIEGIYSPDSSPEESEETNNTRPPRYRNYRQPRTRYKYREITRNRDEENEEELISDDATQSPTFDSSTHARARFYAKRPVSSTEPPVTETLIPAKKFDYAADAHRRQQSLRTTIRNQNEDSTTLSSLNEDRGAEIQNFVDTDYTTTPSLQPLVTRLVTSVEESATTERQKILIKTKYSSLTSTTKIPVQTSISRVLYPTTTVTTIVDTTPTVSSMADTLERSTNTSGETNEENHESVNEIRQGQVERSTLPIEGEFLYQARFTTESHESSTIEIESVFSNLIGTRDSTK
ncbi:Acidic mammalian chitinase [Anthophora quadrimaculata]